MPARPPHGPDADTCRKRVHFDVSTIASAAPRRSVGTWVAVGLVLIVIVFGAVFASRFGRDPDLVASPLIGQAAPDLSLPLLETTGDVLLSDLAGDKTCRTSRRPAPVH